MMILSSEVRSLMKIKGRLPIGCRRFMMDLGDDGYVAEWLGWTDMDCPDGMTLRGRPPSRWMTEGVRWGRNKIARIKKNGGLANVPSYCHDQTSWHWVEREIESRGMSEEYEKAINKILSMSDMDPEKCSGCNGYHVSKRNGMEFTWNALTIGPTDRSAALLIALGHPIMTYDPEDAIIFENLKFEVIKVPKAEPLVTEASFFPEGSFSF